MTDDEIKGYVDAQLQALKAGMIDISSLPEALPDEGTTLPFVKEERLVASPVEGLGGGGGDDDQPLTEADIDAAIAAAG